MKIGEILVRSGKITTQMLDDALARQASEPARRKLGEILVQDGAVTAMDVLHALAGQYHLEVLDSVEASMVEPALTEKIPVDWARQHSILPIRVGVDVAVIMAEPSGLSKLDEVALLLGCEVTGMLAPEYEIKRAIDKAYFERKSPISIKTNEASLRPEGAVLAQENSRTDDLLRVSDSAPVTQLVNSIILEAVRKKASDIHLEPYENHLRIRYRIDGFLYEQPSPPKDLERALISRLKVMSKLDIAEKRLPQDGMARVRAGEREIDIRVSTVPVAEGERVVLRLLNQASSLLPLADLGIPEWMIGKFKEAMAMPNGMILVTGPTGSGKTTTLYAALKELDTAHRNVMTIEDPIEYQIPDIGQIQVKPKIGLTFASGLRHILRQDPDIVLVGEIRDQETAEIAVRAALTGHLVFSTLHTNDAVSAMVRLVDMGIQPYLLASSVRAILAQRLVRRLCPKCSVRYTVDDSWKGELPGFIFDRIHGKSCYAAKGCAHCMQGYSGRIGLYEMFSIGPEEQEYIRKHHQLNSLKELAARQNSGMWRDACDKIISGATSIEEALRVIEPENQVRTT